MAWTWCVQVVGNVPVEDQAAHPRELSNGYGEVAPEDLVAAMVRQQTQIVAMETANLHDGRLSPTRRAHARRAIEWASSSRALVHQHRTLLLQKQLT